MRRSHFLWGCLAGVTLIVSGLVVGCEKQDEISGPGGAGAGHPDRLDLSDTVTPLLANGLDQTTLVAVVVDPEGRPLAGIPVAFTTDHGEITAFASTDANGRAQAILTSEASTTDLTASVTARATADSALGRVQGVPPGALLWVRGEENGAALRDAAIWTERRPVRGATLQESGAAEARDVIEVTMRGVTVQLAGEPSTIPADGITQGQLVATVFETTRRVPVEDQEVLFGTSVGVITGRARTDGSGRAVALLSGVPGEDGAEVTAFYGRTITVQTNVAFAPLRLSFETASAVLVADGASATEAVALLTTESGNPVSGARIDFTTTLGSITSPVTTDETGAATATLQAGGTPGTAQLTARFGSVLTRTAEVTLAPAPSTAVLILDVSPARLVADGSSEAVLRARPLDAGSNPMSDGTPVFFSIESGGGEIIGPARLTRDGVAEAVYVAGLQPGIVTIRAGSGPAEKTVSLELVSGEAGNLALQATPASVLADGVETVALRATLTDRLGNAVGAGVPVSFVTTSGVLTDVLPTDGAGVAGASLQAVAGQTGIARVTASALGLQQTVDVRFVSEAAAHIEAVSAEPAHIGVQGAGDVETASILFQVKDRNGIPVDADHGVTLTFAIVVEDGATDATIEPATVATNENGWARATVNSGTRSGAVEVRASSGGIVSQPIRIAIHGGLPDPPHFSLAFDRVNVEGLVFDGVRNAVTARLGDIHGNPVPESTIVWLSCDYGLVQGSAVTDEHGEATAQEITAAPHPAIPGGDGLVEICAHTVSRLGTDIQVCGNVLWSGPTIVEILSPVNLDVANAGAETIVYAVRDANGNPLVGGTTIQVTTTAGALGGVSTFTLPDTQDPAFTTFDVVLSDDDPDVDQPKAVTVTVDVKSANGNRSASITGTLR